MRKTLQLSGVSKQNLTPPKVQEAEGPGKLAYRHRSQHIAIECERASVVADHQEVAQLYPIGREVIGIRNPGALADTREEESDSVDGNRRTRLGEKEALFTGTAPFGQFLLIRLVGLTRRADGSTSIPPPLPRSRTRSPGESSAFFFLSAYILAVRNSDPLTALGSAHRDEAGVKRTHPGDCVLASAARQHNMPLFRNSGTSVDSREYGLSCPAQSGSTPATAV